jgi:hypothetical protein
MLFLSAAYRFIQSLSHLSSLTSLSLSSFLSVHYIKQLHNIPSLRRLKIDISLFLDPETLAYDPEPLANAHLGDLHITKLHSLDGIGCEQMREICNITTLRKLTVGVKSQASTLVGSGGFLFFVLPHRHLCNCSLLTSALLVLSPKIRRYSTSADSIIKPYLFVHCAV